MVVFSNTNIFDSSVDKSVWKLWSDGSVFNDINMNTAPIDFVIGTGQGFIAGYDTGGFKVTCFSNPDPGYDTGFHWDSGIYYIRTTNTSFANDNNRQTAVRIYAPLTGHMELTKFENSETGWSFIYLDDNGKINEATGLAWSIADPQGTGPTVPNTANKLLIAKIIRDGSNTIQQSDIVDKRKIIHKNDHDSDSQNNYAANEAITTGFKAYLTGSVYARQGDPLLMMANCGCQETAAGAGSIYLGIATGAPGSPEPLLSTQQRHSVIANAYASISTATIVIATGGTNLGYMCLKYADSACKVIYSDLTIINLRNKFIP